MTAAFLRDFMPYGAPDLQDAERPHLSRALALGSLLASLLFAAAWSLSLVLPHSPPRVREVEFDPIFIEPNVAIPPISPVSEMTSVKPSAAKEQVGVPQPVADTPENAEKTLAPPADAQGPPITGEAGTRGMPPAPPAQVGPVNRRGEVLFVDELPAPAREVKPEYPELAKQAGVQGLVIVDVLVGADGRVLEAHIDPKINELMLNESALEAARKWVFTPAMQNGHPVMVWMKLPFRYTLH